MQDYWIVLYVVRTAVVRVMWQAVPTVLPQKYQIKAVKGTTAIGLECVSVRSCLPPKFCPESLAMDDDVTVSRVRQWIVQNNDAPYVCKPLVALLARRSLSSCTCLIHI